MQTHSKELPTISELEVAQQIIENGKKERLWGKGSVGYFDWVKSNWTTRGNPLDFDHHKYLVGIYLDQDAHIVYMKASQVGLTERGLTEAMYMADMYKENSLYVFPTSSAVSDLVQERIDEPLNNSPYLQAVSGRAKKIMGKQADKVGLKRMSKGFVYFRGSNKPTQITSVPTDTAFVDEIDRMPVESVPYIEKRLDHSSRKWQRWFSTPTIPNFGIHKMYLDTDQRHFIVECNHCGGKLDLDFFTHVKYEMKNEKECERAWVECDKCNKEITPYELEGEWISQKPEMRIHGYYISKMYSPFADFRKMVETSLKSAEWEVQQFFNQDLGLPYEPKGGKITEEILQSCKRDYSLGITEGSVYMGVDVGLKLHVIIMTDEKIINITTVKDFEDLDDMMKRYDVNKCVVDALPETRKVQEFADRFKGRVHLCYYTGLKEVKQDEWFKVDGQKVNTDRTLSLDMVTTRFKKQEINLPKSLDDHIEFKENMKALTRIVNEKKDGSLVAEYVHTSPDHYYHACNYANIAKGVFNSGTIPEIFTF